MPPETYELQNQEVFAAGTWNGDTYEIEDLDKMVTAYEATREKFKPKLKLTHEHPKGWPSVGWMENMRRVGSKLFADFKGIPKKVFDMITAGGYSGKSAEVLWNPVVDGKKYPYLMQAVALLGVDLKAVSSISDMMASLYSSEGGEARAYKTEVTEGEIKTYDLEGRRNDMTKEEQLVQDLATANAKLAQAGELAESRSQEIKKFSDENATLKTQVADLTKRAEDAEGKIKEYAEKEVTAKVTSTVDKLIEEKKLPPAMKEKAYSLLRAVMESKTEKKYKFGEKEQSLEDIAVELLGAGGVNLNDSTKTYAGDNKNKKDGEGEINAELSEKAKKYQAAHQGVSFGDALKAVSREEGVDPSLRK
jgi:hypothetical protein